jgi:hypothetical protein
VGVQRGSRPAHDETPVVLSARIGGPLGTYPAIEDRFHDPIYIERERDIKDQRMHSTQSSKIYDK